MINLYNSGVLVNSKGEILTQDTENHKDKISRTIAYNILKEHNISEDMNDLNIKFDALVSPDNNYVSILQTVSAIGIDKFPVPYVLSNCHNTLCAVGGTINQDDHVFGLSNVKKYGGIFIPKYKGVLHQYMRERMAGCGKMILGSDSHTRYGALGTLGIGEGGGELVKQLLSQSYDIKRPEIIGVALKGDVPKGVGPQDVALTIIGKTFKNNFNKNKILEFIGNGVYNLSVEFRMGIDVMTTESAALSSIWVTDDKVENYLDLHGRKYDYKELSITEETYYDKFIEIDLSKIESMMALPYHPSNVVSIREFNKYPEKYLKKVEEDGQKFKGGTGEKFSIMDKLVDGKFYVDQALVSGCSGGMFENICAMNDILSSKKFEMKVGLSVNPSSMPIYMGLMQNGVINSLTTKGVNFNPCICGPCFGVTDVPANNEISIRHVTRNYPNREGAKSSKGQMAATILMDARSIAATVLNDGILTAASSQYIKYSDSSYEYDKKYYENQIIDCYGKGDLSTKLIKGPNIADWEEFYPIEKNMLLRVVKNYKGSITTDDLSPSGDAVAYRSNPLKLAEYTMINKDKTYVSCAKKIKKISENIRENNVVEESDWYKVIDYLKDKTDLSKTTIGSVIASEQIGDGSSREQACSSQKILGGFANITKEFATKRYCSNLINWGMLPIQVDDKTLCQLKEGDFIFITDIHKIVKENNGDCILTMEVISDKNYKIFGKLMSMTEVEKEILLSGCLINYNKKKLDCKQEREGFYEEV